MYRRQIVITHVNKTTVVKVILENITYLVCIDGCIIGQEQNSNKNGMAFTQIHSLEIQTKNQKSCILLAF